MCEKEEEVISPRPAMQTPIPVLIAEAHGEGTWKTWLVRYRLKQQGQGDHKIIIIVAALVMS